MTAWLYLQVYKFIGYFGTLAVIKVYAKQYRRKIYHSHTLTGDGHLDVYVDSMPVPLAQVVGHACELVFQDVIRWRLRISAAATRHQQRRHPQPQQPAPGGHHQTGRMSTAQRLRKSGLSRKSIADLSATPMADERTLDLDRNRRSRRVNGTQCNSDQNAVTNGYGFLSGTIVPFVHAMLSCALSAVGSPACAIFRKPPIGRA